VKPLYLRAAPSIRQLTTVTSAVVLLLTLAAQVRAQSALDGFDPNANGQVRVVAVQPDGKILIGGDFTSVLGVARNRMARLNPDGTLDTAFNPNVNSTVMAIAVQTDGKILVGGFFNGASSIGGQSRNRIARLDATTGLADSFDPNANEGAVFSIAVQRDGKILAGGNFTSIGGQSRNYIARLDPVTGLTDSFDPDPNTPFGFVYSIAVQTDGKILVGGNFTFIGGQPRDLIARLDATTGLADSFNPSTNFIVLSIAVQADGKILVGGHFTIMSGQPRNHIARLDAMTGLADSFDPNANDVVRSIAVQADGRILAGGDFTIISGQARNYIARLSATTGLADSFDPNANGVVRLIAVQMDGGILAVGNFTTLAPNGGAAVTRNRIARLETNGRLDQTLNLSAGGGGTYVTATAVQPDGKILIGGNFLSVLGTTRRGIARLNTDGTLDIAFNPNADGEVRSIAMQSDGKILVGGSFTNIGGQPRNRVARLDATTGLADSFNPNPHGGIGGVYSIAVQPDGKILVGGVFTNIGGEPRNRIARLDATTGLADSFNPNANGSEIDSIAVQADGKILAGGDFTSVGGQLRNRIARLDPTTGLADSFDPNANSVVISIAVGTDGKILVSGVFTNVGGQPRNHIARLDPTTGLADSFDPNANGVVYSVAVGADGNVLAGGDFNGANSIGGQTRNWIARLDATTGLADSFDPNANSLILSIALQADGKVLAGGQFTTIGGQSRSLFARLSNDTTALQNLSVTQTAISWTCGGSSPQFTRVTFEYSADNVNYTLLDKGTPVGSNWTLTGLNLPTAQNFYIRARGYYRSGWQTGSESITESVRIAFIPTPGLVGNVSTRLPVGTDDNVLIEGFIVQGPVGSAKKMMVRALGPSLAFFGIGDALANPTLEIHDSSNATVATNNNWRNTEVGGLITGDQSAEISASGLAPGDDQESAIIANLAPGSYTAVVRGLGNTVGTGLVDAYDISAGSPARLANVATRGFIQPGDKLMIAGFIVQNAPVRAVVRAIGPSLTAFGIGNALPDTTLQLRNENGVVLLENDDWKTDPAQKQELEGTGLQPTNDLEAAVIMTLPPGQYTAQVRGKGESNGIGVVEAYFLQ